MVRISSIFHCREHSFESLERRSSLADSGEFRLAVFSINEVALAAPGGVGFFK